MLNEMRYREKERVRFVSVKKWITQDYKSIGKNILRKLFSVSIKWQCHCSHSLSWIGQKLKWFRTVIQMKAIVKMMMYWKCRRMLAATNNEWTFHTELDVMINVREWPTLNETAYAFTAITEHMCQLNRKTVIKY